MRAARGAEARPWVDRLLAQPMVKMLCGLGKVAQSNPPVQACGMGVLSAQLCPTPAGSTPQEACEAHVLLLLFLNKKAEVHKAGGFQKPHSEGGERV